MAYSHDLMLCYVWVMFFMQKWAEAERFTKPLSLIMGFLKKISPPTQPPTTKKLFLSFQWSK